MVILKLIMFGNLFIFIDISVFTGARSNASSSGWIWNNGTMVDNKNFPCKKNICQQMTWPFTYSDGINLRPKKCKEKSHFICSLPCKFATKHFDKKMHSIKFLN